MLWFLAVDWYVYCCMCVSVCVCTCKYCLVHLYINITPNMTDTTNSCTFLHPVWVILTGSDGISPLVSEEWLRRTGSTSAELTRNAGAWGTCGVLGASVCTFKTSSLRTVFFLWGPLLSSPLLSSPHALTSVWQIGPESTSGYKHTPVLSSVTGTLISEHHTGCGRTGSHKHVEENKKSRGRWASGTRRHGRPYLRLKWTPRGGYVPLYCKLSPSAYITPCGDLGTLQRFKRERVSWPSLGGSRLGGENTCGALSSRC